MKQFLLITADTRDLEYQVVPALDVVESRLAKAEWPIYAGTRNRNAFAVGDRLIFYIGGTKRLSKSFLGTAIVSEIRIPRRSEVSGETDYLNSDAAKVIKLRNIVRFASPPSVYPLLTELDLFRSGTNKWGAALMGGARALSTSDFERILAAGEGANAAPTSELGT